jgi:hypothetical protein
MRAYEFHAGEMVDANVRVTIVDLDSIVRFQEGAAGYDPVRIFWTVTFTDGGFLSITKPAFDRILAAWKSK